MAAAVDPGIYKEAMIVLASAGVVIPLFRKLGINSILGFLLVGILIGPDVLGRFSDLYPWLAPLKLEKTEGAAGLAELGVVFLLFIVGLELTFSRLMTMRRLVFGLGGLQVTLSTAALAAAAYLLGAAPAEAAVIGAALSLSSTAIVVQLLADEKRLASQTGRASFAVLLFQDIAVIPMLIFVGILGQAKNGSVLASAGLALLKASLALAAIYIVGRFLLRPLLRMVANTKSADFFLAATLLIVVGAGVAAGYAGLSMAMGAFLAGLLLAETEYRREIESIIEPFKGLMLGAFFLLVGMDIDLHAVAAAPLEVIGTALLLIAIKVAVMLAAGHFFRIERAALTESALLLGPGGEFAFVLIGSAVALGIVGPAAGGTALIVVSVSMAALPLFARIGRRASKAIAARNGLDPALALPPPDDHQPRVIVIGYGRVGRMVGDMLRNEKIPFLAIESSPELVASARRDGHPVYYGDATRPDFLRRCGITEARALAITMNASRTVELLTELARRENSELKIIARARDDKHAKRLYDLGVTEAVPETFEASLQLGEAILVEAGLPMGLAIAATHELRDIHRKELGRPDRRAEIAKLRHHKANRSAAADRHPQAKT